MKTLETPILVVGGGPVGLSTALHLAHSGIESVIVEKHRSTSIHPKASYFNVRTMEILGQLGVAEELYATALLGAGGGALVGFRSAFLVGWQARQDGAGLPVLRVSGQHLAALVNDVPRGPIQFRYRSPHFGVSVALIPIFSRSSRMKFAILTRSTLSLLVLSVKPTVLPLVSST